MKANKEKGKRAIEASSGKKKSHGFVRTLNWFWREECHICFFFFYSFSQLLISRNQNDKTPPKLSLLPINDKVRLFEEYELKMRLFM